MEQAWADRPACLTGVAALSVGKQCCGPPPTAFRHRDDHRSDCFPAGPEPPLQATVQVRSRWLLLPNDARWCCAAVLLKPLHQSHDARWCCAAVLLKPLHRSWRFHTQRRRRSGAAAQPASVRRVAAGGAGWARPSLRRWRPGVGVGEPFCAHPTLPGPEARCAAAGRTGLCRHCRGGTGAGGASGSRCLELRAGHCGDRGLSTSPHTGSKH